MIIIIIISRELLLHITALHPQKYSNVTVAHTTALHPKDYTLKALLYHTKHHSIFRLQQHN